MKLLIFWCLDYKIWTCFHVLTFVHSSYVKSRIFTSNRTNNCFTMKKLYIYLNISKHLSGAISQNSSEWSLLKVPQQIKTFQKSTAKKILELLQLMLFECFYNIFFKSVTESVFSKVSGLSCKQHIQQVCAGLL